MYKKQNTSLFQHSEHMEKCNISTDFKMYGLIKGDFTLDLVHNLFMCSF